MLLVISLYLILIWSHYDLYVIQYLFHLVFTFQRSQSFDCQKIGFITCHILVSFFFLSYFVSVTSSGIAFKMSRWSLPMRLWYPVIMDTPVHSCLCWSKDWQPSDEPFFIPSSTWSHVLGGLEKIGVVLTFLSGSIVVYLSALSLSLRGTLRGLLILPTAPGLQ